MSDLSRYRGKRNPATTTEPFSAEHAASEPQATGTLTGRFVVHQHAARRMHYDLRLPIFGVLCSFAIPQGPSLDPAIKRLAVRTEDHPKEYLDFEDVIAEGNYGAGAMIVWDTGGVSYNETSAEEGVARGKIDFTLSGFKLHGRFALIATGRRKAATGLAGTDKAAAEWLLIKKPDAHAVPSRDICQELPRSVLSGLTVSELRLRQQLAEQLLQRARQMGAVAPRPTGEGFRPPMICRPAEGPKAGDEWLFELKLDGVRIVAEKSGDKVNLTYRSGRTATRSYPEVVRALRALPVHHLVVDGEIVTFDQRGRPNFSQLAPRIRAERPRDVAQVMLETPVVYLVFDVLELGDERERLDLRGLALERRSDIRADLVRSQGYVRNLDHIVARGEALWQLVEAEELEGMVAKRRSAPYVHGPQKSEDWLKIKRAREDEFVILGWTEGSAGAGDLGALLLGSYQGKELRYRGRVGSGFDRAARHELKVRLEGARRDGPSELAEDLPSELSGAAFCRPELVVRVRHHGYSDAGHLRAAAFLGLRDDVPPEGCTAGPTGEQTSPEAADTAEGEALRSRDVAGATGTGHVVSASRSLDLGLTNLDKVFWPEQGITKGDLIDYYETISAVMLPYLAGRPVVLVRYPDGIDGKSFYQWRLPDRAPPFVRSQELWDEEKQAERGGTKAACLIDSREALLYIINLGCIPLHVLASREGTPSACDFLTLDFDLGPRPLADAVQLVLALRDVLESLGLAGFPKTSGQRGLHVLVPLGPGVPFESAKLLSELLGRLIVAKHPGVCTMERRKDKRGDKLYVDTGQVGRSRTIVAPYSVRAYPGARVSTPLRWEELHLALDPGLFDIHTLPDRVRDLGDPMADLLNQRPDLPATLEKLARWTGR